MMLMFMYRLFDVDDNLLYVGITGNPNDRFRAHAADKSWWNDVARHQIDEIPADSALRIERYTIEDEHPRHNVVHARPARPRLPFRGRMPDSLEDAPELLHEVQAAHALGMSLENIRRLEADDEAFPKRRLIPFGRVTKFRRHELIAWQHSSC